MKKNIKPLFIPKLVVNNNTGAANKEKDKNVQVLFDKPYDKILARALINLERNTYIDILENERISINHKDADDHTPLHFAAAGGNVHAIEMMESLGELDYLAITVTDALNAPGHKVLLLVIAYCFVRIIQRWV